MIRIIKQMIGIVKRSEREGRERQESERRDRLLNRKERDRWRLKEENKEETYYRHVEIIRRRREKERRERD